jgi:hypothetical protein
MKALHTKLTSTDSLKDFCTWLGIVLGVALFLRYDEIQNIQMKDFVPGMFYFHAETGEVIALTIKVCGKADQQQIPLTLYRNDEQPWMCPVRHVLAWISKIGHSHPKDHLIPSQSWLKKFEEEGTKPDGKIPKLKYNTAKNRYNKAFDALNRRGNFGLHTLRKTAYLFAAWGGATPIQLGNCARHASEESVRTYLKDAYAVKILLDTCRYVQYCK